MASDALLNLAETTRAMTRPIDLTALEEAGIIVKVGAWYLVPNMTKLPEHAALKVRIIKQDKSGTKVKFAPVTKAMKRLASKF